MTEHWWTGRALDQSTHERINAQHYPGTRQLCDECGQPTGRCEEDSIYVEDRGPLCEECRDCMTAPEQAPPPSSRRVKGK